MEKNANMRHLSGNLRDAGCTLPMVDKFLRLHEEGNSEGQLRLLRAHRAALLKKVHDNQKRIDCLDYLIFTMARPQ